jgi:GNAT superfamily N-acetyltransferase
VERAILHDEKLGVIVRTQHGEAVGYFAILRIPNSDVGEVAEAVVSPSFRQKGIMTRMMKALLDIASHHGLEGLYGHAVTPHSISQRVNAKYGFKSTALMLAESPAVTYKRLRESYPQPVSILVDFKLLKKLRSASVYLPLRYETLIAQTFQHLGIQYMEGADHNIEWIHRSDIQIEIDYKDNTARLVVREIGKDFESTLGKVTGSLAVKKLNAIYLDLSLEDPATRRVMNVVTQMGYIFCGVLPLIRNSKHYLRMQKVFVNLDFSLIEVYSSLGKQLKEHIKEEYYEHRS